MAGQGLSSDPIFLVDNLSEIAANKHNEVKKLMAKNLEKRFTVDKVWSAQVRNNKFQPIRTQSHNV